MNHAKRQKRVQPRLKHGHLLWKKTVSSFVQLMNFPNHQKTRWLALIESNHWDQMVEDAETWSIQCTDPESYYSVAQLVALVKKYRGVDPKTQSLNPEHKAQVTWLTSESKCQDTNNKFLSEDQAFLSKAYQDLGRAKEYIRGVLGDKPDLQRIYETCDFSSGASIGVHGDRTSLARKYFAKEWTCTSGALRHALSALLRSRYVARGSFHSELDGAPLSTCDDVLRKTKLVPGNKLSFVPKTMRTHRAIAVEPLLNTFVQSGIDVSMRELLATRAGIDLRYQEPNQRIARIGSIDGSYATIDLSSASDTMSRMLVKFLLPYEWWVLLRDSRSPFTTTPSGDVIELEKFCSMGNNFCFPLQTLIFASFCYAAGAPRGAFRVYGDDIGVRTEYAPRVLELLTSYGFIPNPDKTFIEGPFRESCGADWWCGEPVRPAYAVKEWSDIRNVASFHNTALRLWPEKWRPILDEIRRSLPRDQLLLRPMAEADGNAFNASLDECMSGKYVSWNRDLQTWQWREFTSVAVEDRGLSSTGGYSFLAYLAVLRGASSEKPFVHRRKTRTFVRISSYEATATYLP